MIPTAEGAIVFNRRTGKWEPAPGVIPLKTRAEDNRVDRAKTLAELREAANKRADDLGYAKLGVAQQDAATRQFAAENNVSIAQAKLVLEETKQQAQSVGARERSIMDMVKVLAANPVYYRKTPEELRAMAVAAVGAGGGGDAPASAPAAAAKPQPTPEQAAQAIRIAKKAVAGGFPKEEAIKRLRASGVTVPDDF